MDANIETSSGGVWAIRYISQNQTGPSLARSPGNSAAHKHFGDQA
jgi:hypothetical protein